jgi:hypothetical protein
MLTAELFQPYWFGAGVISAETRGPESSATYVEVAEPQAP